VKEDTIILTIDNHVACLSKREAILLRDSLCARLGCPSFCCSSNDTTINGNVVSSNIVIESNIKET
jgi:hypothetical protein